MSEFLRLPTNDILGHITSAHSQDLIHTQTGAWKYEIEHLKNQLSSFPGIHVFFEFAIPRMGKRCDVVIYVNGVVFILEYKVGSPVFDPSDIRQVESYALDLKNFHSGSHTAIIVPVLVATESFISESDALMSTFDVYVPILTSGKNLAEIIRRHDSNKDIGLTNATSWSQSPYKPTPSIVEAAQSLYANHDVRDIARNDAGAKNLYRTSQRILSIAEHSRRNHRKSICFVTGVPGAGKTLVGLDIATRANDEIGAVFLSGNGPLVEVLREALTRDELARAPQLRRAESHSKVSSFIQNVHHFRDEALQYPPNPPSERIVVFDEAQRAWDLHHTRKFMMNKRSQLEFDYSEPEFLMSYVNRHPDWCVVVALIGGGQEINSGEIGLGGWRDAVSRSHSDWDVYFSDHLSQQEYAGGEVHFETLVNQVIHSEKDLHLSVSMRSFRAERLSHFVHHVICGDASAASTCYREFADKYPVYITRDLSSAKNWIREQARGTDTKGVIASSGAIRLRPHGIFVKGQLDAANWFLNGPEDVRSCHALEEAATEFDIQGLELDWCVVGWDADLRMQNGAFEHWEFRGSRWQRRNREVDQRFLENAYRVLLTRARQGMIIFVPHGDITDGTRPHHFYDGTYEYLKNCGIRSLDGENSSRTPNVIPGTGLIQLNLGGAIRST